MTAQPQDPHPPPTQPDRCLHHVHSSFFSSLLPPQGSFDQDACLSLHSINPYSSQESRIIFSTWNLDHRFGILKKNQIPPIWGSVELPGLRLFKMFPLFSSLSLGLKRRGRSSLLWWKLCRITSAPTSTWTTSTACSSPGTTWSWSTSCATRKGHTSCSVTASRSSDGQLAQAQQNRRLLGRRSACCERLWGRSDLFNVNDFWQLPLLQWPDRSIYFKLSCYSAYCSILFVASLCWSGSARKQTLQTTFIILGTVT